MRISQHLVRVVDGKVVYLFKIADQFNSKLNVLSDNFKRIDRTFVEWQGQLKTFSNSVNCHESMTMDFLPSIRRKLIQHLLLFLGYSKFKTR